MKARVKIIVLIAVCVISPVYAGFNFAGYDLEVIASQQGLANAAVSFEANSLWIEAPPEKPYNTQTGFTLPETEQILFSRLYLNVWGGTNSYTCEIELSINGTALDIVYIGGQNDENAVYEPNQVCVYGSGFGSWQVAYNDVEDMLHLDGSENVIEITISDDSGLFDGRIFDASLFAVYKDSEAQYAIDYYLAEADGYMRRTPGSPGSPNHRILNIDDIATENLLSATFTTLYTHGRDDQKDMLFFNNTQLGGDNIAIGAGGLYGPDVVSFDVTDLIESNSSALYTIDEEVTGEISEFSLFAKIAFLEVQRAYCENPPVGDLTGDCRVDINDFALMAQSWLQCNLVPQSSCFE